MYMGIKMKSFFIALLLCVQLFSQETAYFAGGCFWCVESDFDKVKGVLSTTSGYMGGDVPNPTYKEVSRGGTGYVEMVKVVYDPSQISYRDLLTVYWKNIDPTTDQGQFCDKGSQYRPIIFYDNEKQKELAEESKQQIIAENKVKPVLVEILPAKTFYPAEEYHQNYYKKNPLRYKFYRFNCGRDKRLKQLWGNT